MKMEMNALCKISVIIPVYNVEAYLEDCLRSVQQQDFEDVEMICVDDGSTDGSRAILEQFAIQDPRIKILGDGINHGQATARNRAMACAQGEYLLFLDADDMLPAGTLSKLFGIASRDRLDVLMFDYERFYEEGFEKDRAQFPARARYCFPGIGTGAEMLAQMVLHDDADYTACTCLSPERFHHDKASNMEASRGRSGWNGRYRAVRSPTQCGTASREHPDSLSYAPPDAIGYPPSDGSSWM